jgi:hypothetical protein
VRRGIFDVTGHQPCTENARSCRWALDGEAVFAADQQGRCRHGQRHCSRIEVYVGAVRDLLVRERETPSRQIAQSGGVSKDLNARLAVPDHDIATLRRDNHSMQVLHIGRCGEGVTA